MSDLLYLFRYRDLLTDDTLAKHREIIDRKGSCWWGWWQRPGEGLRSGLWRNLAERIERDGPVEIAFFNSDPKLRAGHVHRAVLSEVIPPHENGRAPTVPGAELELVPEYYRGALKLGPEHLVMIPGNHDIAWTKQDDAWDAHKPVEEADDVATKAYRNHYQRVFRHDASPTLSMARRFVLPHGLILEIGGLNSSSLKQGPKWLAGMGRVPDGAFAEISTELSWGTEPSLALRMLVHHHHLTATRTSAALASSGLGAPARPPSPKTATTSTSLRFTPIASRSKSFEPSQSRANAAISAP